MSGLHFGVRFWTPKRGPFCRQIFSHRRKIARVSIVSARTRQKFSMPLLFHGFAAPQALVLHTLRTFMATHVLELYAFESCLTLATITFDMDHTNKPRGLPEGAFCGAGIEQLCLRSDFHNIGPRACENCKSLVEVNLMDTEITALPSSTFAHCVALNCIWLPPRLTLIGKEVFLNCVALQEVVIPTELRDIGNRAFGGCEQLQRFTPLD